MPQFSAMRSVSFHIGTSSWKWDVWKGVFLPPSGDELAGYARVFSTVEIDSTWYHTPAPRVVSSWASRVPAGFRFAAKVPREITHDRLLVDCADALSGFLESMAYLEEARGPLLLQFPPTWSYAEGIRSLHEFAPLLADATERGWQFAAEFRHRSWWRDSVADLLQRFGIAWVLGDTGAWWDTDAPPPLYVTTDWTYIRWRGDRYEEFGPFNALQKNREAAEDRWMETLRELPVDDVWGYFSNQWAGFAPGSAHGFLRRLGQPVAALLPAPQAAPNDDPQQGKLFDL